MFETPNAANNQAQFQSMKNLFKAHWKFHQLLERVKAV